MTTRSGPGSAARPRRERIAVVGVSHRSAPIEVRERFVMGGPALHIWVEELIAKPEVTECVVLSTCNRTECYLSGPDADALQERAREALKAVSGLRSDGDAHFRGAAGLDAARHLFRVVAGLDSLVIGEPQIQGQVASAYRSARPPALGPVLHRLFQSALAAGGRVRSTTSIACGATSIPAAAVRLARKVFGSLHARTALVVGSGDMGQLTARCLQGEGVRRVYVASRNPARAERIGRAVDGIPIERATALDRLDGLDLLVTCTESEAAFVTVEHARRHRSEGAPLVILDIAVPRNVEERAGALRDVFLYNVDDLQRVVDRTHRDRSVERERAEAILERHVAKFWEWHRSRLAAPSIRALREVSRRIVDQALVDARPSGPRDDDVEERTRLAARAALNKILHGPTRAIRWVSERSDGPVCLETLEPALEPPVATGARDGTAGRGAG